MQELAITSQNQQKHLVLSTAESVDHKYFYFSKAADVCIYAKSYFFFQ